MRKEAFFDAGLRPEARGGFAPATPKPKPPKKEKQRRKLSAIASLPLVGTGRRSGKQAEEELPEMGLRG